MKPSLHFLGSATAFRRLAWVFRHRVSWGKRGVALAAAGALLGASLLSGCAVLDKNHRYASRVVEEAMPRNMPVILMTFPVWLVAGSVTVAADALVINPVMSLPPAATDSTIVFTGFPAWGPAEVVLLPLRLVGALSILALSETVRCTVPFVL